MSLRLGNLALEEVLTSRGLVTPEDLARHTGRNKGPAWLADRLVGAGLVTEEQVAHAISEELGYPFVTASPGELDLALVRIVPAHILRAYRALPLLAEGDTVDVAFADPMDSRGIALVASALERRVRPAVATSARILACLREALGPEDVVAPAPPADATWESSGAIRLYSLLLKCVQEGATELLLLPTARGGRVRLRLQGALVDREALDAALLGALTARLKALVGGGAAAASHRGFLTVSIGGRQLHLTVAVVPTEQGDAASVIIGDESAAGREVHDPEALGRLTAFLAGGQGLVVLNSLHPETAAALLRHARRGAGRPLEQWAVCSDGIALDVGASVCLRAEHFPTGLPGAVASARLLRPDVLVVMPQPGVLPPPSALMGAREGQRVVLLGAWGNAAETDEALTGMGLPTGTLGNVLRWILTLRAGGRGTTQAECVRPFDAPEDTPPAPTGSPT